MATFLKILTLHQTNKEFDSAVWLRPDDIKHIMEANIQDRKNRPECNAIVVTSHACFATKDNPPTLIQKIKDCELGTV